MNQWRLIQLIQQLIQRSIIVLNPKTNRQIYISPILIFSCFDHFAKFNARQIFQLYGMVMQDNQNNKQLRPQSITIMYVGECSNTVLV